MLRCFSLLPGVGAVLSGESGLSVDSIRGRIPLRQDCEPAAGSSLSLYIYVWVQLELLRTARLIPEPEPDRFSVVCVQLPIVASSMVSLYFLELTDVVQPAQVGFRCRDRDLSMPYVDGGDELIPLLMLLSLAFAGPAASVLIHSGTVLSDPPEGSPDYPNMNHVFSLSQTHLCFISIVLYVFIYFLIHV